MKLVVLLSVFLGFVCLTGCAVAPASTLGCNQTFALSVTPNVATASHTATGPANQVKFTGTYQQVPQTGCPISNVEALEYASWTNPDTIDIQISSANDATNGTAVCKGPTNGAVTLTGVFSPILANGPAGGGTPQTTETVQLTCQ
jgi:hypothetical protein